VLITGQVEEVRLLVELIEDGTRSVLDVGGSEDGDGVLGKGFGEVCAAFVIFKGRDSGGHWIGEV
jgi:hypothetical protein